MKELEQLRQIFVAEDVDEETRKDNEYKIREWEQDIQKNENLASWQEHDVTRDLIRQAKESYKNLALQLIQDRSLSEKEREIIWAKQDAMMWFIRLGLVDPKKEIETIRASIVQAISAVTN